MNVYFDSSSIVAAEIMALSVCLVIFAGDLRDGSRERSSRDRLFTALVITDVVGLICDMLTCAFDGCADLLPLLCVGTVLSMTLTFVLIAQTSLYIYKYLSELTRLSPAPFRAAAICATACAVATVAASISGQLFYFDNGVYEVGSLYPLYLGINGLAILVGLVLLIANRRALGARDTVVSCLFLIIPAACVTINSFISDFSFAYPAITVSLLLLYTMLQSAQTGRLRKDEQESRYDATHDQLTGLCNRRAYVDALEELMHSSGTVGVLFCDVNGLKYENDHFGHEAGDKLLTTFANLLAGMFRKDEIYRISGDEFVVLLPGMPKESFQHRTDKLAYALTEGDWPIACFGTEFGSCQRAEDLVRMAEAQMYQAKQEFHAQHPEMKR